MNPNITKIIDQYLSGELSSEDKIAFEQKMQESSSLKAEVELQQSIQEGAKRAHLRTTVKKTGKKYHFTKTMKWVAVGISITALATLIGIYLKTGWPLGNSEIDKISLELLKELDANAPIADLEAQYFSISENGEVVFTRNGVLVSVPKDAFLLNGKPFKGNVIVQVQEAMSGSEILKAGLSTMSGNKMLETQGMFGVQGFTPEGKALTLNPKVGVYMQVPVDENKSGMKLFEGVKGADGSIDWQNPKPLAKLPVLADMNDLDFYPQGYEAELDAQKWKQGKKERDSLYLSFEAWEMYKLDTLGYINAVGTIPARKMTPEESYYVYHDKRSIDKYMTEEEALILSKWKKCPSDLKGFIRENLHVSSLEEMLDMTQPSCFLYPSHVLAFWKPKFNNTNLSTVDFEKRMRAIHGTCTNEVLARYTNQLNKGLSEIDAEVVKMGFSEFQQFANENIGKIDVDNAHAKLLQEFYAKGIEKLKASSNEDREKDRKRQEKWDKEMDASRTKEARRAEERANVSLMEEYNFNLENVKKQIGPSVGFTLNHGGGTIVNIDKYVMEATVARTSTTITDPFTGKTAEIVYNDFKFNVAESKKYIKLFAYVFPHELNSYQRIEGANGNFEYPLNNDMLYDIAVVGLTETGYEFFQKQSFKSGNLGTVSMIKITEQKMDESIQLLNNTRNQQKPMNIKDELQWLKKEQADYKEQKQRTNMIEFREGIARIIFPCYSGATETDYAFPADAQ